MKSDAQIPRLGSLAVWKHSVRSTPPRWSTATRPPPWTVSVHSEIPCYRLGLEHVLTEAGFEVLDPEPSTAIRDAAIMTLDTQASHDLAAELARIQVTVLGLLSPPDVKRCRSAFASGVSAVADSRAEPQAIVAMLIAALTGVAVLPLAVLRSLALPEERLGTDQLSVMEVEWLRLLAGGATVAEVAIGAHYSEREMFRRLKSVYIRVGTTERLPAIAAAIESGLFR